MRQYRGQKPAIFDDITADPGDAAVAQVRQRAAAFDDKWRQRYPSAAD